MQELVKSGYMSFTVTDKEYGRFMEYRDHYGLTNDQVLMKILSSREDLQKFASKITKTPESVRVYT